MEKYVKPKVRFAVIWILIRKCLSFILGFGDPGNEGPESSLYRTLMIFFYDVVLPFPKPVVKYNSFIKDVIQLERGMNFSAAGALMRMERSR